MADNPARRFNANVRYQIRREGGRYIVINLDQNRRMNKTHATMREARAHVAQTKRRVAQIIGYHNRAPARAPCADPQCPGAGIRRHRRRYFFRAQVPLRFVR